VVNREFWLFGYGSIMWKTGFEYEARELCLVRDKTRRFWQGSTDHRGTPEFPGRVVTLIDSPGEICWGIAYRLADSRVGQIVRGLDYREKGGYARANVLLELNNGKTIQAITYQAEPDNPNFLGSASTDEIAQQIAISSGPSGTNKEYILRLARILAQNNIQDLHVSELASLVAIKMEDVV
jgi:cation transport regulator ChaC